MRRRSPSYSPPPRRGYVGRGRSPPRGRYGGRRDAPCGLLVRNIPKDSRPEEVRIPFERFGRIRDVYLPNDYYTGAKSLYIVKNAHTYCAYYAPLQTEWLSRICELDSLLN